MRKRKEFHVSRGCLTGTGATKSEAKANMERQIDWACRHAAPQIEMWHGYMVLVAASPDGWNTYVFRPDELQHGDCRRSCTMHGQVEYTDALDSARLHAAMNGWTLECDDDAAFILRSGLTERRRDELSRWICFQRRYAVAKAAGASDGDAHAIACGYKMAA